jgi:hypothetical protein
MSQERSGWPNLQPTTLLRKLKAALSLIHLSAGKRVTKANGAFRRLPGAIRSASQPRILFTQRAVFQGNASRVPPRRGLGVFYDFPRVPLRFTLG